MSEFEGLSARQCHLFLLRAVFQFQIGDEQSSFAKNLFRPIEGGIGFVFGVDRLSQAYHEFPGQCHLKEITLRQHFYETGYDKPVGAKVELSFVLPFK